MSKQKFFPPRPKLNPTIYAYRLIDTTTHQDLIKIGYTTRDAKKRVAEQLKTSRVRYEILFEDSALRNDGSAFTDHEVHALLRKKGFDKFEGEWFRCTVDALKAVVLELQTGIPNEDSRTLDFEMRPEQESAVEKTRHYFKSCVKEDPKSTPHFLWKAKMRFGKTFATYQLAKKMGWKKLLVLTFKPAVQSAWEDDLRSHVDFKGWQFIARNGLSYKDADKSKPFVCFGSFQDFLGKNELGGIKAKNKWVHATNWDCVVFDEYHYGAWREKAKELFEAEDEKEAEFATGEGIEYFVEENMPITTRAYLYLSGTPFRAMASGEFIEEQIYNWTYSDEQRAKAEWKDKTNNPYAALPRMVMLTYQLPDSIRANLSIRHGRRNENLLYYYSIRFLNASATSFFLFSINSLKFVISSEQSGI